MAVSLKYPAYLSAIYEIVCYPIGYTNMGEYPTDRAHAGLGPISSGGIQFDPILRLPFLSTLPYTRPYRRGASLTLPTLPILSILYCHHPTGGESHGLDNRPAANELAPKPYDATTLYGIPQSLRLVVSNPIGPIRIRTILIQPVKYAS